MNLRTLAIVGVIMMAVLAAYAMVGPSGPGTAGKAGAGSRPAEITYSELLARIQAGDIAVGDPEGRHHSRCL